MSCLDTEKEIYAGLFEQLRNASIDKLKFYINIMLSLFSENMVLGSTLWDAWDEETKMAYTYYANLNGPDVLSIEMAVGMGLKNTARDKSEKRYSLSPKINLFM